MTKAELLALADRVEREEPTVLLDAAVELAVNPAARPTSDNPFMLIVGMTVRPPRASTTSLDAAASLVPDGWWIDAVSQTSDDKVYARLDSMDDPVEAIAPTEPRARTAAALRARAMEMKDE